MRPSKILSDHIAETRELMHLYHICELRLYGSVARNLDTEDSDLDVLAIYESDTTIFDHAAFCSSLKRILGIECDVQSGEILACDAFSELMQNSITLEEFEQGSFTSKGDITQEKRNDSSVDNIAWIIKRICSIIQGITYEQFASNPIMYDALAYEFQLLSSIVINSDSEIINAYSSKYNIDFSGCAEMTGILMKTLYPKMLYHTAKKIEMHKV